MPASGLDPGAVPEAPLLPAASIRLRKIIMVLLETAWAPVWAYVVQYVTLCKAIPIVFL